PAPACRRLLFALSRPARPLFRGAAFALRLSARLAEARLAPKAVVAAAAILLVFVAEVGEEDARPAPRGGGVAAHRVEAFAILAAPLLVATGHLDQRSLGGGSAGEGEEAVDLARHPGVGEKREVHPYQAKG